jgi:hypothetical protein
MVLRSNRGMDPISLAEYHRRPRFEMRRLSLVLIGRSETLGSTTNHQLYTTAKYSNHKASNIIEMSIFIGSLLSD